jgi:hypothetical protein
LAAARANAHTSGALQRRDRDLANLTQLANTAAGRAVQRFRIWEGYLSAWARACAKAYGKSARKFGGPEALAPQHLRRVRSAIRSRTQIGIRSLKQSIDTDYATTADGSPRPTAARYASLLAKVMEAADIEIAAIEAEADLDSFAARLQKFCLDHGVKQTDVAYTAKVSDGDLSKVKQNILPASSSPAERIEKVLSGEWQLKLKPRKR